MINNHFHNFTREELVEIRERYAEEYDTTLRENCPRQAGCITCMAKHLCKDLSDLIKDIDTYLKGVETMKVYRIGTRKGDREVVEIKGELRSLQEIVGGYIEPIPSSVCTVGDVVILANEEGLLTGLPINENFPDSFFFVGQCVAVGVGDEDFVSLKDEQVAGLEKWFNDLQ